MKRSSQDKVKSSPTKAASEASKLKDMQKAYGVLPKDAPKSKVSSTKTKSVRTSGGETSSPQGRTTNVSTTPKPRNSTGSHTTTTGRVTVDSSSVRKSYPAADSSKAKSSGSKILAASKANYAEKYGDRGRPKPGTRQPTGVGPALSTSTIARRKSEDNSNPNSPYKQKTSVKAPPKISSSKASASSTSSRLTTQRRPSLYESEAVSEVATEEYDEDFEEDYESDFEEANSTDDEDDDTESNIHAKENGANEVPEDEIEDESVSIKTEDFDKSSSIREFENLEKMLGINTQHISREQDKKLLMTNAQRKIEVNLASGDPGTFPVITKEQIDTEVNEDDEDEDDDEDDDELSTVPESPKIPKQNAFPLTSGFSLSASSNFRNDNAQRNGSERKNLNENKNRMGYNSGNVVGAEARAPIQERGADKMKRTNRGRIIQGMIKLDRVAVDIFHLTPYQYERFMTVFSGTDRLQASTQTDQDKAEESAQTEPIEQTAKWTQKPPTWSTTSSSCDIRIVRQEALGVGSDEICDDLSPDQKIHKQFDFLKNWEQLSKFIIRSSRKMLYVLEAEQRIKLPANLGNKGSLETIKMSRGLSVLSKLGMHTLTGEGEYVACANGQKEIGLKEKTTNGNKKHTSKNLVTVWSLKEPSMPLYFLRVWGHVSALKLHMIGRMVVSGNKDGSLNIWNLDEPICYHSNYQEQVIRTPSVNTSCMTSSHILPIVGIEVFSETKNTASILSVDKEGILITWSCVRSQDHLFESTLSQFSSAWSTIHVSVRHQIQLNEIMRDVLQLTCFFVLLDKGGDISESFCFGTFSGYAVTGNIEVKGGEKGGATAIVEKYQEKADSNPKITCIDISTTLNMLVMGCEDGHCRLFELSRKKMVLCLGGGGTNGEKQLEPIKVKWSGRRASVLYVALKDSLLIWDLLSSDMTPWKTIHLKDIHDFVLYSPPHKEYLVIISGKDLIISTPADEVKPLSSRDFTRIQSYFSLLC